MLCLGQAQAQSSLPTITVTDAAYPAELQPQNVKNPFRTPASSQAHVQTISREEIEQLRLSNQSVAQDLGILKQVLKG